MAGPGRMRGRGRHQYGMAPGMRPVSERERMGIAEQLEAFQRSQEASKRALISDVQVKAWAIVCAVQPSNSSVMCQVSAERRGGI